MTIRPTQTNLFNQVRSGITQGQIRVLRAQLQIASGKRITKPSDDPTGAARVLGLVQRLAGGDRYAAASQTARSRIDYGASNLQDISGLVTETRELLLQGMNGTTNASERELLAENVSQIRSQILELANGKGTGGFLFSGLQTSTKPFVSSVVGGRESVVYTGNGEATEVLVGEDLVVKTGIPGDQVFGQVERSGTQFAGLTGVASGVSGDVGTGRAYLELLNTGTTATLGSGVTLASAGSADTILGAHTVVVDAAQGTVQLDGGSVQSLPQAGDPNLADFAVMNEHGAVVHLDFTGYTGVGFTGSADGQGTISMDGVGAVPIDFVDGDLKLNDPATGVTLHVDTTGIHRAGAELVTFSGSVNLFDALQGIVDDLENTDGLTGPEQVERLEMWLVELDRNQDNVILAMGRLGGSSASLIAVEDRLESRQVDLKGERSLIEDTDFAQAVLDMSQAEQTLELAQATGARLVSNSLLDFLR